jgi:DNA segregation ATPase FtsK/SpoIIIE-like protein
LRYSVYFRASCNFLQGWKDSSGLKSSNFMPVGLKLENKLMADVKTLTHKVRELEKRLEVIEKKLDQKDPLYEDAKRLVVKHHKASISFLQRHLLIDFDRAAKLLAKLQNDRVIRPAAGGEPVKY